MYEGRLRVYIRDYPNRKRVGWLVGTPPIPYVISCQIINSVDPWHELENHYRRVLGGDLLRVVLARMWNFEQLVQNLQQGQPSKATISMEFVVE